jgi:hypothetical protein
VSYKGLRNDELVDGLRAEFQARYEPNFAWKSAVSAFLALPALRAFWPMSSVDYAAASQGRDVAGGAYHLTNNNSADFGSDDLAPYVEFDGVNQYLSRADGGAGNWADILGTEAYIVAGQRGLTFGGWFYPKETGTLEYLFTKRGGGGQRSYWIRFNAADQFVCGISDDGTNSDNATSAAAAVNAWYFVVGRFDPSTLVEVYVNGTWVTQATARAAVFDSTAALVIGADGTVGNYYEGLASLCFVCASDIPDATVFSLFEQTRAMFGV